MTEETQTITGEQMLLEGINQLKATGIKEDVPDIEEQDNEDLQQDDDISNERKKPSGYVEIKDPAVRKRFDEVWRQTRASDEANKVLREHAGHLEQALDKALTKLDRIEEKQQRNDSTSALNRLYSQLKEARDVGDDERALTLEDQIMDVKLEQRDLQKQQKAAVQEVKSIQKQQPTEQYTQAEADYVNMLSEETDNEGNSLRPWLSPNHREYNKALKMGQVIAIEISKKSGQLAPLTEVMKRLDSEMGTYGRSSRKLSENHQEVLSGRDLTRAPKDKTINLDAEQRFVRDRLNIKRLGIDDNVYAKRVAMLSKVTRISADDF